MTPDDFSQRLDAAVTDAQRGGVIYDARLALDLTRNEFAVWLGYEPEHGKSQVVKLEKGHRPLRAPQRLLILAYLAGYRPPEGAR
jgi:hypothetical protein